MALKKVVFEKIDIAAFGGVSGKSIAFGEGVNLINADNECGKSTVLGAIMFALYGFYSQSRSISDNPKKKYMPWSGAAASVVLTIGGDKRLRIERTVSGNKETALCTELTTGLPIYAGKVFGEEILGIGADTAEKALFFSTMEPHQSKDEPLAASLQNLLFSADEQISGEKAVKTITAHKNALKGRTGGLIPRLEVEEMRLSERLDKEKTTAEEYQRLEAEVEQTKKLIAVKEAETEKAEAERENLRRYQAALLLEEHRALTEERYRTEAALTDFGKEHLTVEYVNEYRALTEKEKSAAAECHAIGLELADAMKEDESDDGIEYALGRCKKNKRLAFLSGALCVLFVIAAAVCFVLKTTVLAVAFGVAALVFAVIGVAMATGISNTVKAAGYGSMASLAEAAEEMPRIRAEKEAGIQALQRELKSAEQKHAEITERIEERGAEGDADGMFTDLLKKGKLTSERDNALTALKGFEGKHDVEALKSMAQSAVKPEKSAEQIETEYRFATQGARMLREKLSPALARLEALRMNGSSASVTEEELCLKRRELKEARFTYEALALASECLTEAGVEMKASVSPRISERAGEYFSAATDGRYKGMELDTRLYMSVDGENGVRSAEHLSAGARDMAYLCMRLGLVDLIYGDGKVPLVLDDAFCRQDGTRLKALIAVLAKSGHQIIITSCTDREKRTLDGMGIEYTGIEL